MQRLSIARSLRLALIGLTVALAVVAALGVASLYRARQRYETTLSASSSLATAAANLQTAAIAEPAILLGAGQKPKTDGYLRRVEQLPRQRDHAIDKVGFDQVLANVSLAGLIGRH